MSGMHQPVTQKPLDNAADSAPVLHVIDFEDVALSREGAKLVVEGARAIVRQFMPAADHENLTPAQAIALFIDQVFWEEGSGGLIMCADMPGTSLCLPVPKGHSTVRDDLGQVQ